MSQNRPVVQVRLAGRNRLVVRRPEQSCPDAIYEISQPSDLVNIIDTFDLNDVDMLISDNVREALSKIESLGSRASRFIQELGPL